MLIAIVVVNFVASVLHLGDNMINFHNYPEPTWIQSPHVVDALWFIITPILFLDGGSVHGTQRGQRSR